MVGELYKIAVREGGGVYKLVLHEEHPEEGLLVGEGEASPSQPHC